MSGGHFDYTQYKIDDIADSIEKIVSLNNQMKTQKELDEESWHDESWYQKYPEDLLYSHYDDNTIKAFKAGLDLLRKASIYAQRIDWLLSGDDGEKTFHERLKEDLEIYENYKLR